MSSVDAKKDVLRDLTFGARVAEDEATELAAYFVETEQWARVWRGEIDVVYGAKGSGKSAIYSTLVSRENQLFDRNILIKAAESPKGSLAFSSLASDPPVGEDEYVNLWKLYFLALIADIFDDYDVSGDDARRVCRALADAGLRPGGKVSLRRHVKNSLEYVRRILRPQEVEPTVSWDAAGTITASTRIKFNEPSGAERAQGAIYVNDLFEAANEALSSYGTSLWLVLDRLDVAFAGTPEIEQSALRALFKVYLDLNQLQNVVLKIFLRSDIWNAISSGGFREASHITRELTLEWRRAALLRLVIQRLLRNPKLVEYYHVTPEAILADTSAQQDFFNQVFPFQVDSGPNKPQAFDWCLGRTKDGHKANAPRELIHLLTEARDGQLRRLEIGEPAPAGRTLFDRTALKEALPQVSELRLVKTLYAEYPDVRRYVEMLEGQKTNHGIHTLSNIWGETEERTMEVAGRLVEIGFFEKRGELSSPEYWIPFLYRPGLHLSQGTAEGAAILDEEE